MRSSECGVRIRRLHSAFRNPHSAFDWPRRHCIPLSCPACRQPVRPPDPSTVEVLPARPRPVRRRHDRRRLDHRQRHFSQGQQHRQPGAVGSARSWPCGSSAASPRCAARCRWRNWPRCCRTPAGRTSICAKHMAGVTAFLWGWAEFSIVRTGSLGSLACGTVIYCQQVLKSLESRRAAARLSGRLRAAVALGAVLASRCWPCCR